MTENSVWWDASIHHFLACFDEVTRILLSMKSGEVTVEEALKDPFSTGKDGEEF